MCTRLWLDSCTWITAWMGLPTDGRSTRALMLAMTPDSRSALTRYAHVDSATPTRAASAAFVIRPSSMSAARIARSVPSSDAGACCRIFETVDTRMPLFVVSSYDSPDCLHNLQVRLRFPAKSLTIASMAPMMLQPDSLAVHAGRDDLADLGVHALPLDLSSTNPLPGIDVGGLSYEVLATGGHPFEGGSHVYARLWNPTVARFEEALARLEHAEEAVAFSSGMAAVTAILLALTHESKRRHVVAVRPLYGGTDHLLASGLLGVEATYCTPDAVSAALRPDTALVILESPANPTLELVDIRAVVAAAGDVPVLVDNTLPRRCCSIRSISAAPCPCK